MKTPSWSGNQLKFPVSAFLFLVCCLMGKPGEEVVANYNNEILIFIKSCKPDK